MLVVSLFRFVPSSVCWVCQTGRNCSVLMRSFKMISLHVILVVLLSHYQHRATTKPLTKGASREALYGGFNVWALHTDFNPAGKILTTGTLSEAHREWTATRKRRQRRLLQSHVRCTPLANELYRTVAYFHRELAITGRNYGRCRET